jgi:hypothetical protein
MRHEWSIGIYAGGSPVNVAPAAGVTNPILTREDVLDVPAMFVADPFMIRADGTWHMFFEVLNARTSKGDIGLATSPDGRKWSYRQIVLEERFHLSYPHVFEWRGTHYMIPETYQDNSVRLYEAVAFPTTWSFVGYLLTGQTFADASIFRHRDRWWMFALTSLANDVLRLYSSDELLGPWREHPQSPIIEGNGRIARPGGRVVASNGTLLRFTQDCDPVYGTRVRAFEVLELTETAYREREAAAAPILGPSERGWNAAGMHHIDAHELRAGEWLACVDGWVPV